MGDMNKIIMQTRITIIKDKMFMDTITITTISDQIWHQWDKFRIVLVVLIMFFQMLIPYMDVQQTAAKTANSIGNIGNDINAVSVSVVFVVWIDALFLE